MPTTPSTPSTAQPPVATGVTHGSALNVLAPYPHVAFCVVCRAYADEALTLFAAPAVLCATLAHHDAQHLSDILFTASENFAVEDQSPLD